MNQDQWQMKKDQAGSMSLAAFHGPGALAARGGRGEHSDFTELGATPSATAQHYQTSFDWDAPPEPSK